MPQVTTNTMDPRAGIPGAGRFSFDYYAEILHTAMDAGYRFRSFHEESDEHTVYLRHDLDIDLEKAVEMATLEQRLGVRSTYLPMLNSPTYNLLSTESSLHIRSIIDCGHDVGLHYDPVAHEDTPATITQNLLAEIELFERYMRVRPSVVSFHRPTKIPFDCYADLKGVICTYAPRFFKEIFYYSDSRYRWPEICPQEIFRARTHRRIQLLIHPFWWNQDPTTVEGLIQRQQNRVSRRVSSYFKHQILPAHFRNQGDEA